MNEVMQVEEGRSLPEVRGATPELRGVPEVRGTSPNEETAPALLSPDFVQDLRARWDRVQTAFVDEPRGAVQQADELVNTAIEKLSASFTEARNNLEHQWDRGAEANTEDLRLALRKYRAFFQKILTV